MAVVKWDPFRDLLSIQDRMNTLFEQTLSRSRAEEGIAASTWAPAVDIYETPDTVEMNATSSRRFCSASRASTPRW